jgi:serine/threonine-protein kinase
MSPSLATNPVLDSADLRAGAAGEDSQASGIVLRHDPVVIRTERLGPWILESLISEGALTRVFRARPATAVGEQHASGQYVVKVLRETWHEDRTAIGRMRQEATAGRCVSHRHLAPVLSAHIHRAPFYVVLPWLNGMSVAALLATRGPLETPLALWIARQAAQALEGLHTAGYVHGDVTPKNIFFGSDGHVTLLDLSCARRIGNTMDPAGSAMDEDFVAGTPGYLAPETFVGKWPEPQSDIYSLGLTLFQMLAGRLPPMPEDIAALAIFKREAALPNVRTLAPTAPNAVAAFVQELTAREPLRRPRTAREVADRFMRLEIATLRERLPCI